MAAERRLPVGVLILARDEEANLPDCLHSVAGWAEQVFVVLDPRTRDGSREVAQAWRAEVAEHPFTNYAEQKNWALAELPWRSEWVLIVDADERVSPKLRASVEKALSDPRPKDAYAVRFRFIFYGRWMRHSWYGTWIVRLLRRGRTRYECRGVHEHVLLEGPLGYLEGDLIHDDAKRMDDWITKHNRYATAEAEAHFEGSDSGALRGRLWGSPVERRRFLKERVWKRLPFRPLWLFLYLYVVRLGFLDGRLGLRFCLMHAVFESFVTAKVWEHALLTRGPVPNYYREHLASHLEQHPEERAYYGDPA
jgi:hypothetical protein